MFCDRCGTKLREGAAFCPKCGMIVAPSQTQGEGNSQQVQRAREQQPCENSQQQNANNPQQMSDGGSSSQKPKSRKKRVRIVTFALVDVLLLTGGGFAGWKLWQSRGDAKSVTAEIQKKPHITSTEAPQEATTTESTSTTKATESTEAPTEAFSSEESMDAVTTQSQYPEFEEPVIPQSGEAYLCLADSQWWLQYVGSDWDYLCYGARVVPITGNGTYTVSVTCDTNATRYDTTGDVNGEVIADGVAYMAVQIMDGAYATPSAIIEITSVKVDGTEIPLTKKSYTNTEDTEIDGVTHSNIRSNIYNEWVTDGKIGTEVADARSAEGSLAELVDRSAYSATIIDPSTIGEWKTIEVTFDITGME